MMRITGAMIVRNEAERLGACLDALRQVVEELVIVDTGSNDGTLDIARGYTPHCHSLPWTDDFAAARNAALDHATGDFILVIDADEIIEAPQRAADALRAFAHDATPGCAGTVAIHSVFLDAGVQRLHVDHVERFFARGQFRYVGAIHEQLVAITGAKSSLPTGIRILHMGYLQDPADPGHKARRNIPMLRAEIEGKPDDEYLRFQLGKAHFSIQEWSAAATALDAAAERIDFAAVPPAGSQGPVARVVLTDLLCSLAYARVNLGDARSAAAILAEHAALGHHGTDWADFHHARGYAELMAGNLEAARAAFQAAIGQGSTREDVMGTATFSALYHLGLLDEAQENLAAALSHYLAALQHNNAYTPVVRRCIDLIPERGIVLPDAIFDACDSGTLDRLYLEALCAARDASNWDGAVALCKVAEARAPALAAACAAQLAPQN